MKEKVKNIWPEINWIKDEELKTKVLDCWVYAIENSVLTVEDLEVIPFFPADKRLQCNFYES